MMGTESRREEGLRDEEWERVEEGRLRIRDKRQKKKH